MVKKKTKKFEKANTFVKNVLDVFIENPLSSFNFRQVSGKLGISDSASRDLVKAIIVQLADNGKLILSRRGKYTLDDSNKMTGPEGSSYVVGTIDMKPNGKAYLITDFEGEDVYIVPFNTAHSLHGDNVKVFLFPRRKGKKNEGQVVEIIKRNKTQIVGTLELSKNFAFLVPDSPNMPVDMFIPLSSLYGGEAGQQVIARVTEWPRQ